MVLDRDADLLRDLITRAERRGWETHALPRPTTRRLLVRMGIHALVVDPAVLGSDPWGWIDRVAAGLPGMAVVVCAASSTVGERVQALQRGVDDWLSKPSHPDELIARIETAVRRRRQVDPESAPAGPILGGELEIRCGERQVFAGGRSAELTQREFAVLEAIAEQRGAVVARETIYLRVWDYTMVAGDRSVDVHVRKLRGKLKQLSPDWRYIHTQFRIGYRFQPERFAD